MQSVTQNYPPMVQEDCSPKIHTPFVKMMIHQNFAEKENYFMLDTEVEY